MKGYRYVYRRTLYGAPVQNTYCEECGPPRDPDGTWGYINYTWEIAPEGAMCQCLGSACLDLDRYEMG